MRCASALVFRLRHVLQYDKIFMSKSGAEKSPYTADQVKHMQRQNIRSSKHAFQIWLQEIRPGKGPLRRRNGYKEVRKSTKPYLATHTADMLIDHWIVLFVVTVFEHDMHEVWIGQNPSDDLNDWKWSMTTCIMPV